MENQKKLYRSEKDKVIAGVCGGLAIYFGIDVVLMRLIFLATMFAGVGAGFWVYIILWVTLPTESQLEKQNNEVMKDNVKEIENKAREFAKNVKEAVQDIGKDKKEENKTQEEKKED